MLRRTNKVNKTKVSLGLVAICICFMLITTSLVSANNVYIDEDFNELTEGWKKQYSQSSETANVYFENDWGKTVVRCKAGEGQYPQASLQYVRSMSLEENAGLWVYVVAKINNGQRWGWVQLSFKTDSNDWYQFNIWLEKTDDPTKEGLYRTTSNSYSYKFLPHKWFTIKLNVKQIIGSQFSTFETLLLPFLGVAVGIANEVIDVSYDKFVVAKTDPSLGEIPEIPIADDLDTSEGDSNLMLIAIAAIVIVIIILVVRRK